MKSDNAIRNSTSIFEGIIVAIAAFVRGALLLPLLLVASVTCGASASKAILHAKVSMKSPAAKRFDSMESCRCSTHSHL